MRAFRERIAQVEDTNLGEPLVLDDAFKEDPRLQQAVAFAVMIRQLDGGCGPLWVKLIAGELFRASSHGAHIRDRDVKRHVLRHGHGQVNVAGPGLHAFGFPFFDQLCLHDGSLDPAGRFRLRIHGQCHSRP